MIKKQIIHKFSIICLSLTTALSATPVLKVMAAPDGPGSLTFDCGEGASTCPTKIEFESSSANSWKDTVGEKPIPIKEGHTFVDWEFVSGNPSTDFEPKYDIKPGTLLSDWDSYKVNDLLGAGGGNVIVKAIWKKLDEGTIVPINLSIPSTPINVTLPTTVDLVFSGEDVSAQVANNFSITNNSKIGNIQVSNVKTKVKEIGWILSSKSEDIYFEQLPLDSKEIYLGFSKDSSSYTTLDTAGFDPDIAVGPDGTTNSQNFQIKAKTGGSSTNIDTRIIDLEMTLEYEKVEDARSISIYIDGKEIIATEKTFTFPKGSIAGQGDIQGYNKIRNTQSVMNLSEIPLSNVNETSIVPYAKISTPNIDALFDYFDLKLKETADLPYNCIGSTIDFARSYLVEIRMSDDISDEQSNVIKNNIEAMIHYWKNILNDSGCDWEEGSKTFNYLPSKFFYKNVIYELQEFTSALFNSIGLSIRADFNNLNWIALDGDNEMGKIAWPHYIDYKPGTTIEINDGDSFYSIAG